MVITRVSVQGYEDVLQAYGGANSIVAKELDTAMHKSVMVLKGEAKIQAPVGAENVLRGAIYSRVYGGGFGLTGEVGVGPAAPYGICVHDGTEPHMPPIEAIKQWAERKLGSATEELKPWQWPTKPKKTDAATARAWAIAIHIKKHGTKANPFMARAWDSQQGKINAFFEAAQSNIVKKIGSQA